MLLREKNAVIYGGGAIGGAVARVFAREGARVFIAGRTQARLDAVAHEIAAAGGAAETAQVDAFDQQAVEKHAAAVAANKSRQPRSTRSAQAPHTVAPIHATQNTAISADARSASDHGNRRLASSIAVAANGKPATTPTFNARTRP